MRFLAYPLCYAFMSYVSARMGWGVFLQSGHFAAFLSLVIFLGEGGGRTRSDDVRWAITLTLESGKKQRDRQTSILGDEQIAVAGNISPQNNRH